MVNFKNISAVISAALAAASVGVFPANTTTAFGGIQNSYLTRSKARC